MDYEITSAANPRMKRLARLCRGDREEGLFAVEGRRLVERALHAGFAPEEVYGDGTVEIDGLDPVPVAPGVLDRVSYRDRSEGVVAVFRRRASGLDRVTLGDPALVLLAENLEKPGNLGAILRTADAVGADAVVTVPGEIDVFNPNAIRASTGAVFTVPVAAATVGEAKEWLDGHDITLVAADPMAPRSLWDTDLTGPVALMVGAEDVGLTDEARQTADILVSIPMAGTVDSLNASVSMALLAYEALRQRSSL
ncbi:MAG TPA: RNA methyltransferase [Acidimicrobiia bacterium]